MPRTLSQAPLGLILGLIVLLANLPGTARAQDEAVRMATFEKVWTTVRDRHWDPELGGLDWESVKKDFEPRVRAAKSNGELRTVLNEMIGLLEQSHFGIFPGSTPESDDAVDAPAMDKPPVGDVGSAGEAAPPEDEKFELGDGSGYPGFRTRIVGDSLFVTAVDAGGPAEKAGVQVGWEVERYAGRDVSRWLRRRHGESGEKVNDDIFVVTMVERRMQGDIGKRVPVTFRALRRPTKKSTPATITFEDSSGSKTSRTLNVAHTAWKRGPKITKRLPLVEQPGRDASMGHITDVRVRHQTKLMDDVGYFSFSSFFDPAAIVPAFGEAMTETFKGTKGVIIDVRGNLGGIGFMANGMAGFFVTESNKNLGRMMTRDSTLNFFVNPRPEAYEGPVAILTDGASASTSEIFSGGLKDLGRARIFGTRTAGMALPSLIEELPNGDRFQFAMADCVTPDGHALEGKGVAPHVESPHTRESLARGRDAALDAAIEWIRSTKE